MHVSMTFKYNRVLRKYVRIGGEYHVSLCRSKFCEYFELEHPHEPFDVVATSRRPHNMEAVYKVRVRSSIAEAAPVMQFWNDCRQRWEAESQEVYFYGGMDRAIRRAVLFTAHDPISTTNRWGRPFYIWVEQ